MRTFIIGAILLVACIASASGSDASNPSFDISNLNSTSIREAYNGSLGEFPDSYKSLIGDNRIAIRITALNNSVQSFGLVTKNGLLEDAIDGELADPTIELNVNENAIIKLQNAEDPAAAFEKAIQDKEISVKGNGFINQLKVNVLLGHPVLPELIVTLFAPKE
jgi:hypothetical protein